MSYVKLFNKELLENNYSFLREFEISKNKNSLELIAEGKDDKSLEISYIQIIDEKTIITANKEKLIKIWEKGTVEMPKLTQSNLSERTILNLEKEENDNIIKQEESKELELKEKEKKYYKIEEKEEEIEAKLIKLNEKEKNLKEKERYLNDKEKNLIEKEMK